jgi:hypothetical protein
MRARQSLRDSRPSTTTSSARATIRPSPSVKQSSTHFRGAGKSALVTSPDVSAHLWAGLKSPWGWTFAETPPNAISMQLMQPTIQPEQKMKSKNMTILHLGNLVSRSPWRRGFFLIALPLALTWFALLPTAQAQCPSSCSGNNTALGDGALFSNTSGASNTANGFDALFSNTTGTGNTANGAVALQNNTTGGDNTANGRQALASNTTGSANTANGFGALFNNTTGNFNTATGVSALLSNTTGTGNTANGYQALQSNTTGNNNTATGFNALYNDITGIDNTANGFDALGSNTTGSNNTATGVSALLNNTTSSDNMANGFEALLHNTTGHDNTAEGFQALGHNTTGLSNIAVGSNAGISLTTGSNNIDIGNSGSAGESNKIRIGTVGTQTAAFIAGIHGVAVTGAAVVVSSSGQLGVPPSSERFKDQIKPMNKVSEAILALKPVTFRYKKNIDSEGIPQFGLVAEEVEKVNPDLVMGDAEGKVFTVRYDAVNAMLLNEFLKEHSKVQEQGRKAEEQERTIAQLKKGMEILTAQLQEQASQIQKVSAQLELSKSAPQMAGNDR